MWEKIVIVTRRTRLEELIERFNTRAQAKFYIEHAGGDFADYVAEHETYHRALDEVQTAVDLGLKVQRIDRSFLPTFVFAPSDLVVALGQDGLVANAAKYVGAQPIVGINPDPARIDGVLLPFRTADTRGAVRTVLAGAFRAREVTLAEVRLNDGQRLLAFNDLFVGARSHVSARYRLRVGDASEPQSSSGIIVSTGAGSTGWLSSVFNMAAGVSRVTGGSAGEPIRLARDAARLVYVVREPFVSRHSSASIVAGTLDASQSLVVESLMPNGGAIFSDGIEADYLAFNSGSTATVRVADQRVRLVLPVN